MVPQCPSGKPVSGKDSPAWREDMGRDQADYETRLDSGERSYEANHQVTGFLRSPICWRHIA